MEIKKLHIVSFDNPFPPKYGGVIDVFYKIKKLHQLGVEIKLHCFVDEIPVQNSDLEGFTNEIFYYKRKWKFKYFFSRIPFSVISRQHNDLIYNLSLDKSPILFEGLQTTFLLRKHNFVGRKLFLRLHNIETIYYHGISKSELNLFKKIAYYLEFKKYSYYQNSLKKFEEIFTLSNFETQFINKHFTKGKYIPVFHGNDVFVKCSSYGQYAFYNGDLRISDNKRAVNFLINVFKKIPDYKLVIASSMKIDIFQSKSESANNIVYVKLENNSHLDELLKNAHISVMISFQHSGTKLKVINSLFKSRFCIINNNMLDDLNLKSLCVLAETETDFIKAINTTKKLPYLDFDKRKIILESVLNESDNAKKMLEIIYN